MKVTHIEISDDDDGQRLDRWFRRTYPDVTQPRLQKLLRTGQIRLDGKRVKANARIVAGQVVRVPPIDQGGEGKRTETSEKPKPPNKAHIKELNSLTIHEDEALLVLNKPSGLAVQGGSKTAVHIDAMLESLAHKGERPRLVHRLDRDTSGVLLIAKTRKAASFLGRVFRTRSARKIYWALTDGVPRPPQGEITAHLKKQPSPIGEIVKMVDKGEPGAQHSQSYYAIIEQAAQKFAWVSLKPVTGRTHQLRVHMLALGTPIVSDPKYKIENREEIPEGLGKKLHLHARRLVIPHPNGGSLDISAPLPPHMLQSWQALGLDANRYDNQDEDPEQA